MPKDHETRNVVDRLRTAINKVNKETGLERQDCGNGNHFLVFDLVNELLLPPGEESSNQMKEIEQLAYEVYAAHLGVSLGQPPEPWDKLPETIREAWRFTVKQLLAMVPKEKR